MNRCLPLLCFALCGCAVVQKPPTPTIPPVLRNLSSRRLAAIASVESSAGMPAQPLSLYWEHSGEFTTGFVVERTLDVSSFTAIGFVPVTNPWATNSSDFTYRFQLTNEPPAKAFYRVGAVPTE